MEAQPDVCRYHRSAQAERLRKNPMFNTDNRMERLIQKVRARIQYGFGKKEIADEFRNEYSDEEIFLAYHAALILDK